MRYRHVYTDYYSSNLATALSWIFGIPCSTLMITMGVVFGMCYLNDKVLLTIAEERYISATGMYSLPYAYDNLLTQLSVIPGAVLVIIRIAQFLSGGRLLDDIDLRAQEGKSNLWFPLILIIWLLVYASAILFPSLWAGLLS